MNPELVNIKDSLNPESVCINNSANYELDRINDSVNPESVYKNKSANL